MKSKISVGDPATLASEIAALAEATRTDLKSRWRVLYGTEPPPRISRDLLTRAVAYRIQEEALGGLKPSTRRLLAKVAADASARRPIQVTPAPTLTPGTVLLRDWRGTQHQVIVREHGVEFQGKRYKSLSQVAHRITGSKWSGPLFFGLKAKPQEHADGSTSMGRLTLNVLLSFAQFEREVTGERIRDKIAASKRKGMWMGGVPPLGYEVRERRLVVNPTEANTVRYIYERYLELGCVRQLSKELDEHGIVSKVRISKKGVKSGGCRFSRGALYELLANPIHIGEIRHKQERYPGQHEAIVPRELWERVQQRLRLNAARGRQSSTSAIASPLAGKIFDADGEPLYAQGAAKAGRRYRYYVSRSLVNGSSSDDRKCWRLAAPELERAVAIATQHILSDRAGMLEMLERSGLQSPDLRTTIESTSALSRRLENEADSKALHGRARRPDRTVRRRRTGDTQDPGSLFARGSTDQQHSWSVPLRATQNEAPRCGNADHHRRG